jgi:deoxyribose-phosphate aldolase
MIMGLSELELAQMIDISAVKAGSSLADVETIVSAAKEHHFIAIFPLPSLMVRAKQLLGDRTDIILGGTVGFPSGSSTTRTKVFEAKELVEIGCKELDMVIDIGKLRSNLYQEVAADIREVVDVAGNIPVKVILEVTLLSRQEIMDGARIVRDNGARFVKTGTGWSGSTTTDHLQAIKEAVGETIKIKVAGGVRNLDFLLKIHEMGVTRFGLGYHSALAILKELQDREGNK